MVDDVAPRNGTKLKVGLPKERFWVTVMRELSPGMYVVRCENNLIAYPYRVGDEIEVSLEHFRQP